MSETTKVRVATETKTAEADEAPDYQFLLEENMSLLRAQTQHSAEQLKLTEKISKLEADLATAQVAAKKPTSLRTWRKRLALFHIPFAIALGSSGLVLWVKHLAPPEACFMALPGVVWMVASTIYLDSLASEER